MGVMEKVWVMDLGFSGGLFERCGIKACACEGGCWLWRFAVSA